MKNRNILSDKYFVKTETCWNWIGAKTRNGYGSVWWKRKSEIAHRLVFTLIKGEIPKGLTLDHLCRNRACVNPDHLEPVTNRENVLRGTGIPAQNARKTKCKSGHPFTPENTRTKKGKYRECRICIRRFKKAYKEKLKLKKLPPPLHPAMRVAAVEGN